eukprot:50562-Eustigmatos_ZCMA.PRE.1
MGMTSLLKSRNIDIELAKMIEQQIPLMRGYVAAVQACDSVSLWLSDGRSACSRDRLGLSPWAMSIPSA